MVTKPSVKAHNIFLFTSEEAGYLHMTDIPGTLLDLSGVPKNNYKNWRNGLLQEKKQKCIWCVHFLWLIGYVVMDTKF